MHTITYKEKFQALAFWLSFPWVIPQGLWLKHTAARFPEAEGPREGVIGNFQPKQRFLALGDSVIAGVGHESTGTTLAYSLASSLSEKSQSSIEWQLVGRSGFDSGEIIEQLLPEVAAQPFDFIFISTGVNDVTNMVSATRWQANLLTLFKYLRAHSPNAVIALCGVPPMDKFPLIPKPLNRVLGLRASLLASVGERLCSQQSCIYIPVPTLLSDESFAHDGYHPSPMVCQQWSQQLADELLNPIK